MPPRAQLDHIVVAVSRLDDGIAQFERLTGVRPGVGGRHPGRGTENALVSLGGGSYLEIIAPQPAASLSPRDEMMRRLAHLTIVNWAVCVPEVDAAVGALRGAGFATSPPQPGARLTTSGERLDWMTFGLEDQGITGAPFFIRWSPNTRHPSTTATGGCTLEHLSIAGPDGGRLTKMLRALDVGGIEVTEGAAAIQAALACGSTRAILTSASAT